MRTFTAALVLSLSWGACDRKPDASLPPARLEERNEKLAEVRERLEELDRTDGGVAVELTRHEDHRVRRAAALALMERGERTADAIAELAALLARDEDYRVRTAAARALGATRDLRAVEPLLVSLADADRDVRLWAWKSLLALGEPAYASIAEALASESPALSGKYLDEVKKPHTARDELLSRLPSAGIKLAPAFVPLLASPEPKVQRTALDVLRRMGETARKALPEIAAIVSDETADSPTRIAALKTLEALGDFDPSVIPAVDRALASPDKKVSAQAKKTLAFLKKPVKGAKSDKKAAKKPAKKPGAGAFPRPGPGGRPVQPSR